MPLQPIMDGASLALFQSAPAIAGGRCALSKG
jgi:hypothetical protein